MKHIFMSIAIMTCLTHASTMVAFTGSVTNKSTQKQSVVIFARARLSPLRPTVAEFDLQPNEKKEYSTGLKANSFILYIQAGQRYVTAWSQNHSTEETTNWIIYDKTPTETDPAVTRIEKAN